MNLYLLTNFANGKMYLGCQGGQQGHCHVLLLVIALQSLLASFPPFLPHFLGNYSFHSPVFGVVVTGVWRWGLKAEESWREKEIPPQGVVDRQEEGEDWANDHELITLASRPGGGGGDSGFQVTGMIEGSFWV